MKKVYSSPSDVIHLFSSQSQSVANCSNVFFEDKSLYSYGYHYKMATFIKGGAVVINDRGYSVTTNKHISQTRSACSHYKQFLTTEIDVNFVYDKVKDLVSLIPTARKRKAEYINEINYLFNSLNNFQDYAKANKIKRERLFNSTSESVIFDKRAVKYKYIKKIVSLLSNDLQKLEGEILEVKRKAKAKIDKANKIKIVNFYTYKTDFVRLENEILRVSECGQFVESSQNIRTDIITARMVCNGVTLGADLRGRKIDYHTIKGIINGCLVIGCHKIKLTEIEKINKIINLN